LGTEREKKFEKKVKVCTHVDERVDGEQVVRQLRPEDDVHLLHSNVNLLRELEEVATFVFS